MKSAHGNFQWLQKCSASFLRGEKNKIFSRRFFCFFFDARRAGPRCAGLTGAARCAMRRGGFFHQRGPENAPARIVACQDALLYLLCMSRL
jgi:hypothetical protein